MIWNKQSRDSALSATERDVVSGRRLVRGIISRSLEGIMKKIGTKDLILIALLVGLNVVLSRFLSINAWNIKIGFTFLTIYVGAYFYEAIGGMLVGGLGDLIGSLLFPTGPYFPGFTLTAVLTGLLYGTLLKKKRNTSIIVATCLINEFVINLLINTYWIHLVYNANYLALLSTRLIQAIVKAVVGVISIKLILKAMPSFERRVRQ